MYIPGNKSNVGCQWNQKLSCMQHDQWLQWLTWPLFAAHAGDVAAISATFQVEYPISFLVCLQLMFSELLSWYHWSTPHRYYRRLKTCTTWDVESVQYIMGSYHNLNSSRMSTLNNTQHPGSSWWINVHLNLHYFLPYISSIPKHQHY